MTVYRDKNGLCFGFAGRNKTLIISRTLIRDLIHEVDNDVDFVTRLKEAISSGSIEVILP